jgi:hypothetical protein
MAQTVKIRRSAVANKVPNTGSLELGELAVNTTDGKLYFVKEDSEKSVEQILTTSANITGSLQIDQLTLNDSFSYGNTVWNETSGINQLSGSSFQFRSGTPPELQIHNGSDEVIFKVDDKVVVLGARNTTPTAVEGGMFYSGSGDWFVGMQ